MDFIFRRNIVNVIEKKHSYTLESFDLIDIENKNDIFLDELGVYFDFCMLEDKNVPAICIINIKMVDNGDYNYDDEWEPHYQEHYEYRELNFCPFTGDKINIIIKEIIDMTDIYNELEKELKELKRKYQSNKNKTRINEIYEMFYKFHHRQINYKMKTE